MSHNKTTLAEMHAYLEKAQEHIVKYMVQLAKTLPENRENWWTQQISGTLLAYHKELVEVNLQDYYKPQDSDTPNDKTYARMAAIYIQLLNAKTLPPNASDEIIDVYKALYTPGKLLPPGNGPDNILMDDTPHAGIGLKNQKYDITVLASTLTKITMLRVLIERYEAIQKFSHDNPHEVNLTPAWLQKQFDEVTKIAQTPQNYVIINKNNENAKKFTLKIPLGSRTLHLNLKSLGYGFLLIMVWGACAAISITLLFLMVKYTPYLDSDAAAFLLFMPFIITYPLWDFLLKNYSHDAISIFPSIPKAGPAANETLQPWVGLTLADEPLPAPAALHFAYSVTPLPNGLPAENPAVASDPHPPVHSNTRPSPGV